MMEIQEVNIVKQGVSDKLIEVVFGSDEIDDVLKIRINRSDAVFLIKQLRDRVFIGIDGGEG